MIFILRLILAFVAFWFLMRLVRAIAQFFAPSRPASRPDVHARRPSGRNLGEGRTVIDVDYTEKRKGPSSGDSSS